jgi:hypothetical protein
VQDTAETRDMVVERGIGPVRGDHRIARLDQQAHEVAQEPVDPLAHDEVRGPDAQMRGKRGLQVMALRVAVFPQFGRGRGDRLDRARRGAEAVLVRPQPRGEGRAAGAFLRLGADEGTVAGSDRTRLV